MATDSDDLTELHEFAAKLGMRRSWFQNKSIPHYDLTYEQWVLAQQYGAKLVSPKELVRRCHPKHKHSGE